MGKLFRIYFILLVIFSVIASCSSQKTVEDSSGSLALKEPQTTLKWLGQWFNEGKKETLVKETAREFAFLNQDIAVDLKFSFQATGIDSFADPFRPVADSIARWIREDRWPYDFMLCDTWFYRDIAAVLNDPNWGAKHLVDFQNEQWFIDAHKEYVLDVDEYKGNFGGIAPGTFLEGAWNLLYVSSLVEEKLGLKVKDYDMTIDDFMEYARVVQNYNQTHTDKITLCATNYITMETFVRHLVMSELGSLNTRSNDEKLRVLSTVYKKLEQLSQYQPDLQQHTYSSDRELKHDKSLFHLHSTWVSMFWQNTNPEGEKIMRPCELPSMTGKVARAYSGTYNAIFVVPKKAKNKEAAIRLMKFISTPDIAEKWENYSKCPTGLKSRFSLNEFGTDGFSSLSKHMTLKYNNHLEDKTISQTLFNSSTILTYELEVLKGTMSAEKAIQNIRRQL
jgi:ABC-type glycerol-3-phosphate transport system substrate-binding protein